jgi:uncharacterized protein (TIGR00297 family)
MDTSIINARSVLSPLLSLGLAAHGYRKGSLSLSGAIAAVIVGWSTFLSGFQFGVTLIVFYYTSSKLTKYQQEKKKRVEAEFKQDGQRDVWQVMSNSLTATVLATCYYHMFGPDLIPFAFHNSSIINPSSLQAGFIAFYATCTADTWASELGILSASSPILITTLKRV